MSNKPNLQFTGELNKFLEVSDLKEKIIDGIHYYDISVEGINGLKLKKTRIMIAKGTNDVKRWLEAGGEGRVRYKKTPDGKSWMGLIYDTPEDAKKAEKENKEIKALPMDK